MMMPIPPHAHILPCRVREAADEITRPPLDHPESLRTALLDTVRVRTCLIAAGIIVIMSAKRKKPPIDKEATLTRLARAQQNQLLVTVRRWIPNADRLEGFVVVIGQKWVALQRLSDRIVFDGWQLIRVKDIQAISVDPDPDCFEVKALKARSLWPPSAPDLTLDDVVSAVGSASAGTAMVSVFDEFDRPDLCWIGEVTSLDDSKLHSLEVNTRAGWARKPRTFDPADVTRIDFGGGYEEALRLVAGSPPAE
jgi:hypothetical protein